MPQESPSLAGATAMIVLRKLCGLKYGTPARLNASRNTGFARLYDIPSRVLPKAVVEAPVPEEADAVRELVRRSAGHLGVANEKELRDYYRLPVAGFKIALRELVDAGELTPVTVGAERGVSYLVPGVKVPRKVNAATLVSPFDPIVWNRGRSERLFDFHYRIEIYVPAEKRVHGYYVLPFLNDGRLVARVDLKADRQTSRLLVRAAHPEPTWDDDQDLPPLVERLTEINRGRAFFTTPENLGDYVLVDFIEHKRQQARTRSAG